MTWIDRGWYLVVEFEQSSSNSFERALRLVQAHESYCQLMDHRGHVFHRGTFRATDASAAWDLLDLVKQWRGTRLYVKGDQADPGHVHTQLDCYLWHVDHAGIESCPLAPGEDWPFPKACGGAWDAIRFIWPGRGGAWWFEFGAFEGENAYVIKKDLVRQLANQHANAHRTCPVFHLAHLDDLLERLPESSDLDGSPDWQRVELARVSPWHTGTVSEKDATIQPRSVEGYRRYMGRVFGGLQFEWPLQEAQGSP